MKSVIQDKPGRSGIVNPCCLCYMNSVNQLLYSIESFSNYILSLPDLMLYSDNGNSDGIKKRDRGNYEFKSSKQMKYENENEIEIEGKINDNDR